MAKTMKIYMLTSVAGPTFSYGGGGVFDVPELIGREMLKAGHAREVQKDDLPKTDGALITRTADAKAPKKRLRRGKKK